MEAEFYNNVFNNPKILNHVFILSVTEMARAILIIACFLILLVGDINGKSENGSQYDQCFLDCVSDLENNCETPSGSRIASAACNSNRNTYCRGKCEDKAWYKTTEDENFELNEKEKEIDELKKILQSLT